VSDVVSRSIRGKTLMYEIRRTGRKDKDNTWEPLNFLQNMAPYVMKMVKRYDEVMKAQEGGAAIRPLTTPEIRKHLADFQLDGQLADSRIKGFSGGQKSRLVLAAALWNRPHILALDEPTNYLDQEALGALARSITSFQGGVLMVSHNKEFVSQVRALPASNVNRGGPISIPFEFLSRGAASTASHSGARCARWVTMRASCGDAKSSLGDDESSLGDAKSSLGDATSSLGDAKSSLGDGMWQPQVCSEAWLVKAGPTEAGAQVYCNVRKEPGEELFSMEVTDQMFDFVPKKQKAERKGRKAAKEKVEEEADAVGEAKDEHEALRTCTGNLTSQPQAMDVKVSEFSMAVGGKELIKSTALEFTAGGVGPAGGDLREGRLGGQV
jgi:hypothetical protein